MRFFTIFGNNISTKPTIINMKKVNIIYWIFTILLILLMAFSAVGSFFSNPQSEIMLKQLGYMPYIIKFLAVAKGLGIIALLVPGFRRLKEWAYAGFTFDLIYATYSFIKVGDPLSGWAPMFGFIIILGLAYYFHIKKQTAGIVK